MWLKCLFAAVIAKLCKGFIFDFLEHESTEYPDSYGVDVSFPIHHGIDRLRYADQFHRYERMMEGCEKKYGSHPCRQTEVDRLQMNLDQPKSQHNYTKLGFDHRVAPKEMFKDVLTFFMNNKEREKAEEWPPGNTYVNHWDSPTSMVSFEDAGLRGGLALKSRIWAAVQPIIEDWTGHRVEPTSLYGIRIYKSGAILATHVDRLPLVSSCIIQVAQDVEEDWPLEVYDHDGQAHNVTMKPGDMVLYESHTVLHGRPFPLKGKYYANIFVHFKPIDHDEMNRRDFLEDNESPDEVDQNNADSVPEFHRHRRAQLLEERHRRESMRRNAGGHEQSNHILHAKNEGTGKADIRAKPEPRRDPFRRGLDVRTLQTLGDMARNESRSVSESAMT